LGDRATAEEKPCERRHNSRHALTARKTPLFLSNERRPSQLHGVFLFLRLQFWLADAQRQLDVLVDLIKCEIGSRTGQRNRTFADYVLAQPAAGGVAPMAGRSLSTLLDDEISLKRGALVVLLELLAAIGSGCAVVPLCRRSAVPSFRCAAVPPCRRSAVPLCRRSAVSPDP
jgi:hypothetical protein